MEVAGAGGRSAVRRRRRQVAELVAAQLRRRKVNARKSCEENARPAERSGSCKWRSKVQVGSANAAKK